MIYREMRDRWNTYGIQKLYFLLLVVVLGFQGCWSLNSEGLALLEFRAKVNHDPYHVFANWNPNDSDPCKWSGVLCVDGEVQILDMKGNLLEGVLAPELGSLTHLRSLVLFENRFSGGIPKEIGRLTMLEVLDLRDNHFSGTLPSEIGGLQSLKRMLICNNNFVGSIPPELENLNFLSEVQFDENLTFAVAGGIGCVNRKFGHCIWQNSLKQLKKADSFLIPIKHALISYLNVPLSKFGKGSSLHRDPYKCYDNLPIPPEAHAIQNAENLVATVRRRRLQQSYNLAAAPASGGPPPEPTTALPINRRSGSFPAVPKEKKGQPAPSPSSPLEANDTSKSDGQSNTSASGNTWTYILLILVLILLLIIAGVTYFMCRNRAASTIRPWKTGLSGQLQKAFITGVPKLNRAELETACEDFSNITETRVACTIYKGTLSSGVEIGVVSTSTTCLKDWSKSSEAAYRRKIETLSRVNHKNFVNLIGYCEEEEPFTRMMVFEYAPNGTLFEYLHVKEVEYLDWNARVRVIMGLAYCLQYMHSLNPPVAHTNLNSKFIYLTDDYAAKIAEICFSKKDATKSRISGDLSEHCELPPTSDLPTNVYSFGILLLEIISGKVPNSEEQGPLEKWASQYLDDKRSISYMIDPTLKSFKNNELDVICEVIEECIQQDASKRPSMKEVTAKLREVITVTPDAATPRLSPLWWAELEILSAEAT